MVRVLAILGIIALIVFSIIAHFTAPCSAFKYSAVKDVPARCLGVGQ